MVKQIQRIRRQESKNCLSVFDHFVGLAVKGISNILIVWVILVAVDAMWFFRGILGKYDPFLSILLKKISKTDLLVETS